MTNLMWIRSLRAVIGQSGDKMGQVCGWAGLIAHRKGRARRRAVLEGRPTDSILTLTLHSVLVFARQKFALWPSANVL